MKLQSENTSCWIYICRTQEEAADLQIGFSHSLPQMLTSSQGKQLLYYRQFASSVDGLGHKLLLEKLSSESLIQMILHVNGRLDDLRNEFILPYEEKTSD